MSQAPSTFWKHAVQRTQASFRRPFRNVPPIRLRLQANATAASLLFDTDNSRGSCRSRYLRRVRSRSCSIHVFHVSDGANGYRLEFDAEALTWTLVAMLPEQP